MPTFTTIIEDTAPIIEYSSDWIAGTSENDRYIDKYSQSSYTVTSTDGASLSFTFYGNAVQLYGSKRPNHGTYSVELDGYIYPEASSYASDPGNFQVSLFSASALADGEHTLTLTNRGSSELDVDFISWDTTIGNTDDNLILKTFKDNDPSFVYSPYSSWSTMPRRAGLFMGGSGHVTTKNDGTVEFNFQGKKRTVSPIQCNGVAIYGPVGPDGGPYTAQIDGGSSKTLTTNNTSYRPQMMLYYANHLGAGTHTVKLSPLSSAAGSSSQVLAIDYAVVYTTGGTESASGVNGAGIHTAAVAGISVGTTVAFFVLIGSIIYVWQRFKHRQRWRTRRHRKEEIDPAPKVEPFQYASAPSTLGMNSSIHLSEFAQPSTPSEFLSPMSTPHVKPSTLSDDGSSGINKHEMDPSGSSISFHSTSYADSTVESYQGQRPLLRHLPSEKELFRMSVQNGVDAYGPLRTGERAAAESSMSDRRRLSEALPEYSR